MYLFMYNDICVEFVYVWILAMYTVHILFRLWCKHSGSDMSHIPDADTSDFGCDVSGSGFDMSEDLQDMFL